MKTASKALLPATTALFLLAAVPAAVAGPAPDYRCAPEAYRGYQGLTDAFGAVNWYKDLKANAARGNAAAASRLASYNACRTSQQRSTKR